MANAAPAEEDLSDHVGRFLEWRVLMNSTPAEKDSCKLRGLLSETRLSLEQYLPRRLG